MQKLPHHRLRQTHCFGQPALEYVHAHTRRDAHGQVEGIVDAQHEADAGQSGIGVPPIPVIEEWNAKGNAGLVEGHERFVEGNAVSLEIEIIPQSLPGTVVVFVV